MDRHFLSENIFLVQFEQGKSGESELFTDEFTWILTEKKFKQVVCMKLLRASVYACSVMSMSHGL